MGTSEQDWDPGKDALPFLLLEKLPCVLDSDRERDVSFRSSKHVLAPESPSDLHMTRELVTVYSRHLAVKGLVTSARTSLPLNKGNGKDLLFFPTVTSD